MQLKPSNRTALCSNPSASRSSWAAKRRGASPPAIVQKQSVAALSCCVIVALLCGSFNLGADEVADKGREVFKKHQRAVVTVQLVQKMTSSASGRAGEAQEVKQDITGTVVDPSGLTVLALSSTDPTENVLMRTARPLRSNP